jgi:phage terminase small subunit
MVKPIACAVGFLFGGGMHLSRQQEIFVSEYLTCWNAAEAARRAGYSTRTAKAQGLNLLKTPKIAAVIAERIAEKAMTADEALTLLTEQARANIGVFLKVAERWTSAPLGTQEIIDEKDEVDAKGALRHFYLVRYIAIDTAKLVDPRYSRLVKKFSETTQRGIAFELYDAQAALEKLGKALGVLTERLTVTNQALIGELPPIDEGKEHDVSAAPGAADSLPPLASL